MTNLTTFDLINLTSSLVSLILSVLAISLALYFYNKSRDAEKNAELAINKISEATTTLSTISMKMITKLTNYVTSPNPTEQSLLAIISELKPVSPLNIAKEMPGRPTLAQLDQFRVDNLIAALYYASVANTSLQLFLPEDIGEISNAEAVVRMVDQSKGDYLTLKSWIFASTTQRLNESPNKHMYDGAIELEESVRSVSEFYAAKQNTPM